jgi:hypothetical protein
LNGKGVIMNSPILTKAAAHVENNKWRTTAAYFCILTLVLLASFTASAQTTTTVQTGGTPNAAVPEAISNFTIPRAAIVLNGTALNAQGFPVRHLWVGDNVFGMCRLDPDLDTPGIKIVNFNTCPFKILGLSVTGGPMNYDPVNKFIYLSDVRKSLGIFRIKYDPTADSGQGNVDLTSIFAMAGNQSGARFQGGQTGCPFPNGVGVGSVSLGPDGNLWVTGAKGGQIIRINNPATAADTGFGTCADFVQVVASSPDGATTGDMAWIGHDLWSADGTSPFVISNADTTCQALAPGMTPTCAATSSLAAIGAATTTASDQMFPQLNGNNLYFGLPAVTGPPLVPGILFWVADAHGAQTIDSAFINPADIAASLPASFPPPNPYPLGIPGQPGVDYNDPANLVVYTGDDPSNNGVTIPSPVVGAPAGLGLGRFWETCQGNPPAVAAPFSLNVLSVNDCPTPAATAIPGAPKVARAKAGNVQAIVSWSAAQSNQPVTSYRVRTFINGNPLSDTIVNPAAGSAFPPTTVTIPLANSTSNTYTFSIAARNNLGESALSAASNGVKLPGIDTPGIPTQLNAVAGNASALVSWSAPAQIGGAPISSYTVTVIRQSIRTNTTFTVLAPDTTAVITGLTNANDYSFSVHATNAGGNGMESTPTNLVTPAATPGAITVSVTGPSLPVLQFLPANLTFAVNVTNNTPNAVSAGNILATLTQAAPDGAFLFFAQPTQGSCSAGGNGVLSVTCPLGTIAALTTVTINVTATIQSNVATLDATFTGLDINTNPVSSFGTFTLTPPAPPAPATDIQITGSAQNGGPTVTGTLPTGAPDTYTWQVKNSQNVQAPNVGFKNTMPGSLRFDSVTLNPAAVGTCTGPAPGTLGGTITCSIPNLAGAGQFTVVANVHVVQTGTIQNTATVTYAGDTNNANNTTTVTIKAK